MRCSVAGLVVVVCLTAACSDDDETAPETMGMGGTSNDGGGGAGASAGMGGSGGTPSNALPLGTAAEQADCPLAGAPPNSLCKSLTISCPGVADEDVNLQVYPPMTTPERGTVILGTGGLGTGFFNPNVIDALRTAGFRTVNRAWATGWENGPDGGMAAAACRYATMITWVHEQSWVTGPMCVTGNSGGASEIGYALARYGRDTIIDFAQPNGGPPMGRLDHGCVGDAAWMTECDQLTSSTACAGTVACVYDTNQRGIIDAAYATDSCAAMDEGMRDTWLADSVVSDDALLDYPGTPVHFIFGDQDCTIALPLGLIYANAITSNKTIDYVAAPHAVFSTDAGRAAIVSAIDAGCME